jgi:DNA-binding transcriptional LysR family regulator
MAERRPTLRSALTRVDVLSLRIFLDVCEERHFGRAAAREHLAPSAVTKRIQALEELFGGPLLHRFARGVEPTAMGEELARHAREVLDAFERMHAGLENHSTGAQGHVRVYANTSVVVEFLAADLGRFAAAHPHIRLELHERVSRDVVAAVARDASGIGVHAAGAAADVGLEARTYRRDRLVVLLPPGHALAARASLGFDDLLALPLIHVNDASAIAALLHDTARSRGRDLRFRHYATSNEVARSLVAAGLGCTVQPDGLTAVAHAWSRRGPSAPDAPHVVPLAEPWADRELRLCHRPAADLPLPARTLVDFLGGNGPR